MDREAEFLACLLANGTPPWIKYSSVRGVPIVSAIYHTRVQEWWHCTKKDTPWTFIISPEFEPWWIDYKLWLRSHELMPDAGLSRHYG